MSTIERQDLDKTGDIYTFSEIGISIPNPDVIIPEITLQEGVKNFLSIIDERTTSKNGLPTFVMLSGRTSAGKTSAVTSEILTHYGENATVLSMDHYSRGNRFIAEMAEQGISINWDHPLYMDFDLLREHITELSQGNTIHHPEFSFKTGEREGTMLFEPRDVVVVEGLFALRDEIADLADVKGFVDISLHGSIIRRLMRDVHRTNLDPADILNYYLTTVEPMYQEHVSPTKANADLVMVNEYNPAVESHRTGKHEVQTKFKAYISTEDLRKAQAIPLGVVDQQDYYFCPTDRSLGDTDEMVRIRHQGGKKTLTYKGPKVEAGEIVRARFDVQLDDETSDIEQLLRERYGQSVLQINKTRGIYFLGDTVVNLDSVSRKEGDEEVPIGNFVEVCMYDVKSGSQKLRLVCERLGIEYESSIPHSYSEMIPSE